MEKGFEAIKKGTMNTAKAVTKTLNTISDTIKKLASLYVLKTVFDKLKNYLDTTIRKNREFAASMKNLRGSLAAAFQPIYETIAPGLIYFVNILNYVVQAIGRFTAAISGKSYAQMLKNAEALSKQKDALDGVGGAAADAQRQLMGFDEINKLNEPGAGTGMSFNELDLGSMGGAIDDFAKRLRDLILSGQFQQAGDLVANAANQIISSLDLSAIATRTAGWINNLTEFSNAVGFGIDWNGLGKKFADGVSTFLATLNGYALGKTLSLKFAIAIKTLSGFIKNLKWQTVGQTLGDAILGFSQGLGKTISQSLDSEFWETLNKNITDGFTAFAPGFIESLRIAVDTIAEQAPGVLQSIGNVGNQIVAMINDSIDMMDEKVVIGKLDKFDDRGFQLNRIGSRWEKLGYSLAEGLSDVDWSGIFTGTAVSLEKLSIGLCDLLTAALSKLVECSGVFSSVSNMKLGPMGTSIRIGGTPSYQPMLENLVHCADGAIIPPNREFLAVFGDQRSGNNIETPEALMRQIVREESGDSGIQTLVEQMDELIRAVMGIRVGDDVIGRSAARYIRRHGMSTNG